MNLIENWDKIRTHFNESFRSNLHVSIASVDDKNNPTVTPIGSLFLNKKQKGFYFEIFTKKLPINGRRNKNICVLAVNSGTWFWIRSLFNGKFGQYPAIKLYGELGERREATEIEISRLRRRMKSVSMTKGHEILWGNLPYVRDITFTSGEKINIGKMTKEL